MLPWRLTEALKREDLTIDEYVVLVYLSATIDHETWDKPVAERRVVTELTVIAAEIGWTKTQERLRQVIGELEQEGWIGFESRAGSKKWTMWLTRAALDGRGAGFGALGGTSKSDGGADLEVSSKRGGGADGANPVREREETAVEPPKGARPLDVDIDADRNLTEGVVGFEVEGTTARAREEFDDLPLDDPHLEPDVREAVERGRALRQHAASADELADQLAQGRAREDLDEPFDLIASTDEMLRLLGLEHRRDFEAGLISEARYGTLAAAFPVDDPPETADTVAVDRLADRIRRETVEERYTGLLAALPEHEADTVAAVIDMFDGVVTGVESDDHGRNGDAG